MPKFTILLLLVCVVSACSKKDTFISMDAAVAPAKPALEPRLSTRRMSALESKGNIWNNVASNSSRDTTAYSNSESQPQAIALETEPVSKSEAELELEAQMELDNTLSDYNTETTAVDRVAIGVWVCDEFLERYHTCYAQLPVETQSSMKLRLEMTQSQLHQTAQLEYAEEVLIEVCTHLNKEMEPSMKLKGCDWYYN